MKNSILSLISFSLIASFSFAQNPGGVSASSSNELWFDASQLNLTNGSLVSTWTDASGNNKNATAVKTNHRPTYNTGMVNGKPAVTFDGVDDALQTGSVPNLNTDKITTFAVFDGSAANHVGFILGGNYSTHSQFYSLSRNNGAIKYWIISPPSSPIFTQTTINPTYQIYNSNWNGTSGLVSSYLNGGQYKTKTSATTTPSGNNYYRIGANPAGAGSYRFNGAIAEIFTYSNILNSAERFIIENYLGAKYGISVPNDMYSYQGSYSYDLIGIGQEADGNNLTAKGVSPLGLTIGSLSNGEYVMAAHDNAGYLTNTVDVPNPGDVRYNQVWRVDVTGAPGTVDVTMDVSTYGLGATGSYNLLVDGDGVFAAGATSYAGAYAAGTVTFSGVTLSSGDYLTLSNGSSAISSTGTTTDWHTTTTWDCGCIPTLASAVDIQLGHTVDINGQNAEAASLVVNGTLTFSGSDTLSILGDLTNSGTFTSGSGAVLLNGTAAQNLTGTLALNDLIIDNSAGVTNAGVLSIKNFLDVVSGSISTGNNLTFISDASGTGSIANPSTGTIVGDITVQRYLDEGTNGNSWYLLCSGLIGGDLEDWNQEFEMQGFPGTEWPDTTSSVYYFDQNNISTDFNEGYTVPGNTTDIMDNTVGYDLYVGDDTYATGPRTINITGTAALGSIPISAPHVDKLAGDEDDGWTLMANPYASPVLWNNIQKTGNYDNAYRRMSNGTNGLMNVYYVLGVGEAFWVHSDPGGATLTFDPEDVNSVNIDRYNDRVGNPNPSVKLSLLSDNVEFDNCQIELNEFASNQRERGVDAYKLNTIVKTNPNLSTMVDGSRFQLNVLNLNDNHIIPVNIFTEQPLMKVNNYVLKLENIQSLLNQNKVVYLEDKKLGKMVAVSEDMEYSFNSFKNEDLNRFNLHISDQAIDINNNLSSRIEIFQYNNNLNINLNNINDKEIKIQISNQLGQVVYVNDHLIEAKNAKVIDLSNLGIKEGFYVVTINDGEFLHSQKLLFNK